MEITYYGGVDEVGTDIEVKLPKYGKTYTF